jgi:hypothetical protein
LQAHQFCLSDIPSFIPEMPAGFTSYMVHHSRPKENFAKMEGADPF